MTIMGIKIPNVIRAQVVLQGASGTPEDRYVNTFHFETVDSTPPTEADFDKARNLLRELYGVVAPGADFPLNTFISKVVKRDDSSHIRMYDLGEDEPRTPRIGTLNLPAAPNDLVLPNEVAVVASYFGGRNIPGRRGRFYLGPLTTLAYGVFDGSDARPSLQLRTAIANACARMAAQANDVRWVVLSTGRRELIDTPKGKRRQGALLPPARWNVSGGWVDDAFDTQRRRGEDAITRTPWVSALEP